MNRITRLFLCLILLSIALAAPAGAAPQFITLVNFNGINGEYPDGLIQDSMGNLYGTTIYGGISHTNFITGPGTVFKLSPLRTLTTLVNFTGMTGAYLGVEPYGLIQDSAGNLYGTTASGGSDGLGTVFKLSPSGTLTTLVSFTGTNGEYPSASLIQGTDGNLYGTTASGGSGGYGTVFKISPTGTFITLVNFDNYTNGAVPDISLLDNQGNLYGTTDEGGNSGYGTVFKISPTGMFTTLVNFNGANGESPYLSLLDSAGNLYGSTQVGGSFYVDPKNPGYGTVFKISPTGTFTTLVNFNGANGAYGASLIQDSQGNLYGITSVGGSSYHSPNDAGYGTIFKLSPAGTLTTLINFNNIGGAHPQAALLQGNDGNFYGTTANGGSSGHGYGTIFKMSPAGTLTTLVNFDYGNGAYPSGSLIQRSDGNLYGITQEGGTSNAGTVFELTLPDTASPATPTSLLPSTIQAGTLPFVLTVIGTGFSQGVTADFNGTPLTPTSVTSTQVIYNVPASLVATPGSFNVTVTNPGAVASNALPFTVTPGLTLTGVSPAVANAGSNPISITVTGTNFVSGCVVKWNGQPLLTYYLTPTAATATVPASYLATPTTAKITISNPHVFATAPLPFTVIAPPIITGFMPSSGSVGTPVTITGANLTGTTVVGFQGKHATLFTVNSSGTQITTTVPAGAQTGPVAVLTKGMEAKSAASFTVTP